VVVEQMPELVYRVAPLYPNEIKPEGEEQAVIFRILVGVEGDVKKVQFEQRCGIFELDRAAKKAVFWWLYSPALQNRQPIAYWVTDTVLFNSDLNEGPRGRAVVIAEGKGEYPELTHKAVPEYSKLAVIGGLKGKVTLRVLVDLKGEVKEVVIQKSSGYEVLDAAAVEAAKKCRFKPGKIKGTPFQCWVSFNYNFVLTGN
ncbi:MAG: energy transducer TonB, partial [candidate division Zixibacteria bacterium]